jgi:hypothetical protein
MLEGSCLCGAVRYEIDGELGPVVLCHCSMCRKAQGSAFTANAPVPARAFRIVQGEAALRAYRSSPHKVRVFCATCGSPIYSRRDGADDLRIRVGSLDTPFESRPTAHIHVASKAAWWEIADDLPQHPGFEPGRQ